MEEVFSNRNRVINVENLNDIDINKHNVYSTDELNCIDRYKKGQGSVIVNGKFSCPEINIIECVGSTRYNYQRGV